MKLLRNIVTDVGCEKSMDARREDAVHDLKGAKTDRNEAHGKLKLE